MANEMDEFDRIEAEWEEKHPNWRRDADNEDEDGQLQFYPLPAGQQYPLAQVPATTAAPASDSMLARRLGPLPVWGWGLLAVVGGGVGYYFYSHQDEGKKVKRNRGSSDDGLGDDTEPSSGFKASRTDFAEKLHGHLRKNGLAEKVTIFRDADDAKKKLKQVSPLVTMKCQTRPPLKALDQFAKREGLTAIEHDDNVVGFYPGGGKKGKAWEDYVDALRDDGQEV